MFRLVLTWCLLAASTSHSYEPLSAYKHVQLQGWQLYIHRDYFRPKKRKLKQIVVKIAKGQLAAAIRVLPPEAVKQLRQVSLWLEYTSRCKGNSAAFRTGTPAAFRQRGLHPKKVNGIELCGAKIVYDTVHTMPAQLIHELAHAYHALIATDAHKRQIKRAFALAKRRGLYRKVKMYKAPPQRAYALHNEREYFAEATESFFGRNNAYPFHRRQLKTYDPVGYKMVIDVWKVLYTPPSYPIDYGYGSY